MDVRTLEMETWEGESSGPGPGDEEEAGESLRMISTSRDRLKGKLRLGGRPDSILLDPFPPPLEDLVLLLLLLLLLLPPLPLLPPPVLVRVVPEGDTPLAQY